MTEHVSTQVRPATSRVQELAGQGTHAGGSRYRRPAREYAPAMKLIGIKVPATLHSYLLGRFRGTCDRLGMTSAELLDYLLDVLERDEIKRDHLSGNPLTVSVGN